MCTAYFEERGHSSEFMHIDFKHTHTPSWLQSRVERNKHTLLSRKPQSDTVNVLQCLIACHLFDKKKKDCIFSLESICVHITLPRVTIIVSPSIYYKWTVSPSLSNMTFITSCRSGVSRGHLLWLYKGFNEVSSAKHCVSAVTRWH